MNSAYPAPGELFNLRGRIAVVTGAGRGIGEGIARSLASAGAKVVLAARRTGEIEGVAANSLTQTASAELAPRIRVNGIAPGAVPTEIFKKAMGIETTEELDAAKKAWNIPMDRFGTPLDMGACAVFLCSDAASWITGETIRVGGGAKPR